MGMIPRIFKAKVMHHRHAPRRNRFIYNSMYLVLPLSQLKTLPLPVNRAGPISFHTCDHGPRDKKADLQQWARQMLRDADITTADGEIILITLPRILGYVFNPVSFWLCYDRYENLRAVLYEVNNTFGETHVYISARPDERPITASDTLQAEKMFHVSPFMDRKGEYDFRIQVTQTSGGVWINHYTENGEKLLSTSVTGRMMPMKDKASFVLWLQYPFLTFKTVFLIHWQALKLFFKGVRYRPKPHQCQRKMSKTAQPKDK